MNSYLHERGHLLQQWGADPVASELARTLHDGAWLAVSDLPTCVASKTGGRQGCKLGSITLNGIYGVFFPQGDVIDADRTVRELCRRESWLAACILNVQKAVRPMIEEDRRVYLDNLARSASSALDSNDTRQAHAVVRMLSGRAAKPCQNIRRPDGTRTETAQEVKEAWQAHNATCSVFRGDIVKQSDLR